MMTQQGVQKGRFWVTDSTATKNDASDPSSNIIRASTADGDVSNGIQGSSQVQEAQPTQTYQQGRFLVVKSENDLAAVGNAVIAVPTGMGEVSSIMLEGNSQLQEAQPTQTYQQGRFLVVKSDNDLAAAGNVIQHTPVHEENIVPAVILLDSQNQTIPGEVTQDSNANANTYQQGRFFVVKTDNIETDIPVNHHSNNPELFPASGTSVTATALAESKDSNINTNTYQQGRFLVVKSDSIDIDTTETDTPIDHHIKGEHIPTSGGGMVATLSAESQDANINKSTYQQGRFLVVKSDTIDTTAIPDAHKDATSASKMDASDPQSKSQVNTNPAIQAGGVQVGRVFVTEPFRRTSTSMRPEQQVSQELLVPLPPVTAKVARQPQQKTLASELQRISNQNHKLHHMLRTLLKAQGIEVPAGSANKTGGTISDDTKKPRSLGNSNMGGSSGSIVSSVGGSSLTAPKQHIAAAADPHRLQELCSDLTSGSKNLIMEYNALKAKNQVLTKQLRDTKTQLKEMTSNCENLKSQLAAYKQKA